MREQRGNYQRFLVPRPLRIPNRFPAIATAANDFYVYCRLNSMRRPQPARDYCQRQTKRCWGDLGLESEHRDSKSDLAVSCPSPNVAGRAQNPFNSPFVGSPRWGHEGKIAVGSRCL